MKTTLEKLLYGTDARYDGDLKNMQVNVSTDPERCGADNILFITKTSLGRSRELDLSNCHPAAVLCEEDEYISSSAPVIRCTNARRCLSIALSNLYGIDYSKTKFIAVTGTNGKTSTARLVYDILRFNGKNVGFIGTGAILINDVSISDIYYSMTTPDPEELYPIIKKMQQLDCEYIVMEASSHALKLEKLAPIRFEIGIFTNLSAEHTDFHKDMYDYYRSKLSLFEKCNIGIFNMDDEYSSRAYCECKCARISVGILRSADVYASDIELRGLHGSSFFYRENGLIFGIDLKLIGAFNIYNALMALKCAILLGIKPCMAKKAILCEMGIIGRMEHIHDDITVIIDYAHTPFATKNALKILKSAKTSRQKLIVVFGCGGERDRSKRSEIGRTAAEYADLIIITEDNSRKENPQEIVNDIIAGIPSKCNYTVIHNRGEAIRQAILNAESGDIVAILGKGHERYIVKGDGYHPFSEKEIVRAALVERNGRNSLEN